MSPEQALNKLRRLREWNKMTDTKRDALDVAIKAVEAHDVAVYANKITVVTGNEDLFLPSGIEMIEFLCPCCNCNLGIRLVKKYCQAPITFPIFCHNCGQKLKTPEDTEELGG